MTPVFRLANDADIDILIELMRQFYAIDHYVFEEQVARKALKDLIDTSSFGRVWLITEGEEVLGYLVVTFGYSLEYHGRDAFIDELFIIAHRRNQGIGARAVQLAVDTCSDLSIHALHLEVEQSNVAGQALYRRFGFEGKDRYLLTKWMAR